MLFVRCDGGISHDPRESEDGRADDEVAARRALRAALDGPGA